MKTSKQWSSYKTSKQWSIKMKTSKQWSSYKTSKISLTAIKHQSRFI